MLWSIVMLVFMMSALGETLDITSIFNLNANFVTISKDGNTIAIASKTNQPELYSLIILKKQYSRYEQINVTNAHVYIPSSKQLFLHKYAHQQNFKPRFSFDGISILFIDYFKGYLATFQLKNLSAGSTPANISWFSADCPYRTSLSQPILCYYDINNSNGGLIIYNHKNLELTQYPNGRKNKSKLAQSFLFTQNNNLKLISFKSEITYANSVTLFIINQTSQSYLNFGLDGSFSYEKSQVWYNQPMQIINLYEKFQVILDLTYFSPGLSGYFFNHHKITMTNKTSSVNITMVAESFTSSILTFHRNLIGISYISEKINHISLLTSQNNINSKPFVDLKITQSKAIMDFSFNENGSRLAYANHAGELYIINHQIGVQDIVQCQNSQLSQKYCCEGKVAHTLSYLSFALVTPTFLFLVIISLCLYIRYLKKTRAPKQRNIEQLPQGQPANPIENTEQNLAVKIEQKSNTSNNASSTGIKKSENPQETQDNNKKVISFEIKQTIYFSG